MSEANEVPNHIVWGVFGFLGLVALIVVGATPQTSTSPSLGLASSSGCPVGSTRTPLRDEVMVRTEPSESAPNLLNRKATEMLGRTHYHQVDSSTVVRVVSCSGDWVEIAIAEPDWLRHVKGWIPSESVLRNSEISAAQPSKPAFGAFNTEAARATEALSCQSPKITPAQFGDGALYGCIQGAAETAKYWINEDGANSGRVENVKVMWNNWTTDRGWGVHADFDEAVGMVAAATRLYAPELQNELITAFFAKDSRSWISGSFQLEYRWTPGPAIDEHLLEIKPR